MNKQLDLLCLLDETNQERDSISDQLIDLSQALEEAFSRLVPFVHSYLNRLEVCFSFFLYNKKNNSIIYYFYYI